MIEIFKGTILREEIIYLLLYNMIFLLVNSLAYYELNKKIKKKYLIFILLICCIIIGVFSKLGSDYYNYFKIVKGQGYYNIEFLYKKLIIISGQNISLYFLYVMIINTILIYILIKKLKIKYAVFFMSFWINFCYLDSLNIIRSIQAQLITLCGIVFYLKRKYLKSYILLIGSFFFHKTSILNLFLINLKVIKKINLKYIFGAIIIGILGNRFIFRVLNVIFYDSKYIVYVNNTVEANFSWWFLNISLLVIKILFLVYFLYVFQKNEFFYSKYKFIVQGLCFGTLICLSLIFINLSPYVVIRFLVIIFSYNLILLPKYLECAKLTTFDKIIYFGSALIILILNNIYIIRMLYARFLNFY